MGQVPFSGSLIIPIEPCDPLDFEQRFFSIQEIPEIIKFIKETGRLQLAITAEPIRYKGLDYLEPIFKELNPPLLHLVPLSILSASDGETMKSFASFNSLASIKYYNFLREISSGNQRVIRGTLDQLPYTYVYLKAANCTFTDLIEDLLIDDPLKAHLLLSACRDFIVDPGAGLRNTIRNGSIADYKISQILPKVFQPKAFFPVEIGKFLVNKLTYAPSGMRACNEIIDNYDDYDLREVQTSLNEAIVTKNLDKINQTSDALSEILENVWNDQTIINRIKNIKIGLPASFAAIGGIAGMLAAGSAGGITGGFLSNLGFKIGEKVIDKVFDEKGGNLTESLAKFRTRSYQVNIYDFKKLYKHQIRHN